MLSFLPSWKPTFSACPFYINPRPHEPAHCHLSGAAGLVTCAWGWTRARGGGGLWSADTVCHKTRAAPCRHCRRCCKREGPIFRKWGPRPPCPKNGPLTSPARAHGAARHRNDASYAPKKKIDGGRCTQALGRPKNAAPFANHEKLSTKNCGDATKAARTLQEGPVLMVRRVALRPRVALTAAAGAAVRCRPGIRVVPVLRRHSGGSSRLVEGGDAGRNDAAG